VSPHSFDEPLRLLIVDDDEVDRQAIRRHLAASGVKATIDEVADARELVARLATESYDCLILDHHLPGETSLEVISRVRAAALDTPILCVTGQDEEAGAASVAAGASDFLSKVDLSPSRLSRRLRYVLRLGRAEREARRVRAALEAQRRLLDAVIAQLPTGVVVVDAEHGGVLVANTRAEEIVGVAGRALADDDAEPALAQARQVLAEATRTGTAASGEGTVTHRGRELRLGAAPVILDTGRAAMLVIDDVTDEVAALRRAEHAAQAREDVLAIVSHDMRGPLSAIGIALDGLRDPDLDAGLRERCVSAVQRSVERAERLIRDLLLAHQLEVRGVQVELRSLDVRALLDRVLHEHELVAGQDRTQLVIAVATDVGVVRADRDRLGQAFANLIGNALRHARGTPTIELGAHRRADGAIALTVRDHGPGIAVDALPHVFDRYWQGRHRRGGAGLGLAIVRGIAQAHGGDATVRNHPDGGAEFAIVLPAP
jgi:signal transduction histidine kinase